MDLIVKEVKTNDQNAEEKMVNTVADKAAQEILALSHH